MKLLFQKNYLFRTENNILLLFAAYIFGIWIWKKKWKRIFFLIKQNFLKASPRIHNKNPSAYFWFNFVFRVWTSFLGDILIRYQFLCGEYLAKKGTHWVEFFLCLRSFILFNFIIAIRFSSYSAHKVSVDRFRSDIL